MRSKPTPSHLLRAAAVFAVLVWALAAGPPAGADEVRVYRSGVGGEGAFLGVSLEEETEHPEGGARVTEVVEGSPAEEAGLRAGDIIQGFDGNRIRGPVSLTERIRERKPGDRVSLKLVRDGNASEVEVELGEREVMWRSHGDVFGIPLDEEKLEKLKELGEEWREEFPEGEPFKFEMAPRAFAVGWGRPRLGVQLAETTPELRTHFGASEDAGVLVSKVLEGMPAEKSGVRVGDLIVAVDGEPVATAGELAQAIRSAEGTVRIEIFRERKKMTIDVTLPDEKSIDRPTGPRAYLAPPTAPAPAPGASLAEPPMFRRAAGAPAPATPSPVAPTPSLAPLPPLPPLAPPPPPPPEPLPRAERWV
jgi:predicted metalloprotease with PDZ domain